MNGKVKNNYLRLYQNENEETLMKKAAFLVMIITIISKVIGFAREIALSYVYGASAITDAYLISQTIPIVIFSFISAGITTGYIPIYSKIQQGDGKLNAARFTSNLSNSLLLLATIIVVFVLLFTQPVVKLFASGFSGETLELAVRFTKISVFGVYFTAVLNIFSGYLRVHEHYLAPALIGFPMNLIIICSLFISTKSNVYVIAFGSLLAIASQFVVLIPFLRKTRYQHQMVVDLMDEYIKQMFLIALPVIIGTSVNEINVLVDRTLASRITVGGISALNYARRLNGFVQGLVVVSLTSVMFPMISKMAAASNINDLKRTINEAMTSMSLLIVPATVGAMIFAEEIVALLFGRGAFTAEAIAMTGNALFYYSIGMIAIGLRDVLSRTFYALQDSKTPMINATIGVVLNIGLNIILSRCLGIGGLALATSISAIVAVGLLFVSLRRKIGGLGLRELSKSLVKIGLASVIMGVIVRSGFNYLRQSLGQNLALIIAIGIGVVIYSILIYSMRIPEVDQTIAAVKRRLRARHDVKGRSE
jgi:putative peptidoglycan lipid II flippase